jgi:hypothetical protein
MLFIGSVVVSCSLVHCFVDCWFLLFGSSLLVWGPGAAVGHVHAFSLVWCLLFSFVYFGFAGLGSCVDSWSCFF